MMVKTRKQPCAEIRSAVGAFGEVLLARAEAGYNDFGFVTSDTVGEDSPYGQLIRKFPSQAVDVGIAESDQVGVSAGMSLGGEQIVFSKGFGIFLAQRAADQINVDICYNHLPVRLITDHCGVTAAGGPTHNMVNDLAITRAFPGLTIVSPADAIEAKRIAEMSFDYPGPMYIRFSKGIDPLIYQTEDYPLEIGKAVTLRKGKDITLIGMGISVSWVLQAADILENAGIGVTVLNMHTVKPLDREAVLAAAENTKGIVTVEDHSVIGGLGSAVAELLSECGMHTRMYKVAFPDIYMPPETIEQTYRRYGITPEDIAKKAIEIINQ